MPAVGHGLLSGQWGAGKTWCTILVHGERSRSGWRDVGPCAVLRGELLNPVRASDKIVAFWQADSREPRRASAPAGPAGRWHPRVHESHCEEVEAAGFVLDAESTMLANKDDPHSMKVFDPSIKGETDRFAYQFVKP
jgi:hypothetical protein